MSTEFQNVVSICLHTVVDLFAGLAIALPVDTFFAAHNPPGTGDFVKVLFSTVAQACITMLAADELRKLMWADQSQDPTGAVMFIVALWKPQKIFWTKIKELWLMLISSFLTSGNEASNPDDATHTN